MLRPLICKTARDERYENTCALLPMRSQMHWTRRWVRPLLIVHVRWTGLRTGAWPARDAVDVQLLASASTSPPPRASHAASRDSTPAGGAHGVRESRCQLRWALPAPLVLQMRSAVVAATTTRPHKHALFFSNNRSLLQYNDAALMALPQTREMHARNVRNWRHAPCAARTCARTNR